MGLNTIQFSLLFSSCVVGTILFLAWAIGLESGNPYAQTIMSFIVKHIVAIFVGSIVICSLTVFVVLKGKKK